METCFQKKKKNGNFEKHHKLELIVQAVTDARDKIQLQIRKQKIETFEVPRRSNLFASKLDSRILESQASTTN